MAWTAKITSTKFSELTGNPILEGTVEQGATEYAFWAQATRRGLSADVYRRTSKTGRGWAAASPAQEQAIQAAYNTSAAR